MTGSDYDYYSGWKRRDDNNEPYLDGRETQALFKQEKWFAETENQCYGKAKETAKKLL